MDYGNRGVAMKKLGNMKKPCSDWKRTCEVGDCSKYESAKRKGWCE